MKTMQRSPHRRWRAAAAGLLAALCLGAGSVASAALFDHYFSISDREPKSPLEEAEAMRVRAAIDAAVEVLALTEAQVRAGIRYYSCYQREIDAEIESADRYSAEAERRWRQEQELLK